MGDRVDPKPFSSEIVDQTSEWMSEWARKQTYQWSHGYRSLRFVQDRRKRATTMKGAMEQDSSWRASNGTTSSLELKFTGQRVEFLWGVLSVFGNCCSFMSKREQEEISIWLSNFYSDVRSRSLLFLLFPCCLLSCCFWPGRSTHKLISFYIQSCILLTHVLFTDRWSTIQFDSNLLALRAALPSSSSPSSSL